MRWFVLIWVLLNVWAINAFNLEARIPVIKRGLSGSYFGYSVAEHQELTEDGTEKAKSWLVIFKNVTNTKSRLFHASFSFTSSYFKSKHT